MVTRSDIVKEALSWIGTPWHHHQGVKGAGVDCVQFALRVGQEVGLVDRDFKIDNYEPLARGKFLVRHLERLCDRVEKFKPGSIILMRHGALDTHVGIVLFPCTSFIHASARHKEVVRTSLGRYLPNVRAFYDYKGVMDG